MLFTITIVSSIAELSAWLYGIASHDRVSSALVRPRGGTDYDRFSDVRRQYNTSNNSVDHQSKMHTEHVATRKFITLKLLHANYICNVLFLLPCIHVLLTAGLN
jgi:hypothetical protein